VDKKIEDYAKMKAEFKQKEVDEFETGP